jgi:hypothetical protein
MEDNINVYSSDSEHILKITSFIIPEIKNELKTIRKLYQK